VNRELEVDASLAPWHQPAIGTSRSPGCAPGADCRSTDREFAPNTKTRVAPSGALNADPVNVTTLVIFSSAARPRVT
jgi:hypothetical protein